MGGLDWRINRMAIRITLFYIYTKKLNTRPLMGWRDDWTGSCSHRSGCVAVESGLTLPRGFSRTPSVASIGKLRKHLALRVGVAHSIVDKLGAHVSFGSR
ncbi:MAG: hypothetical protein AMXMBFR7_13610 [Planctomycetota bacterium]